MGSTQVYWLPVCEIVLDIVHTLWVQKLRWLNVLYQQHLISLACFFCSLTCFYFLGFFSRNFILSVIPAFRIQPTSILRGSRWRRDGPIQSFGHSSQDRCILVNPKSKTYLLNSLSQSGSVGLFFLQGSVLVQCATKFGCFN